MSSVKSDDVKLVLDGQSDSGGDKYILHATFAWFSFCSFFWPGINFLAIYWTL